MRFVTVAEKLAPHKPKGCDHTCERYAMQEGTAWKMDVYGKHEVVALDAAQAKRAEYTYCTAHYDGREMAIFELDKAEYRQPVEADARATDTRLGSKRKIRKLKKQRREAPGVAKAINWENDGPAPKEERERPTRRTKAPALAPGESKPYRRAGPRGGLTLA